MPKSTLICVCKYCGSSFCTECSDAVEWFNFCSEKCEEEAKTEKEKEADACAD